MNREYISMKIFAIFSACLPRSGLRHSTYSTNLIPFIHLSQAFNRFEWILFRHSASIIAEMLLILEFTAPSERIISKIPYIGYKGSFEFVLHK